MKHFYFSKTLLIAATLLVGSATQAQNETNSTNGNCGVVTQNFNNGTGGFTSKSVYSSSIFDSTFYYNTTRGYWTEIGSAGHERSIANGNTPPSVPRTVSILSPAYVNPNPAGIFDVGFFYIVPNPSIDQFFITLVRLTQDAAGNTLSDVVAESNFKTFSQFSTPTVYTDPVNAQHSGYRGAVCIRLIDPDITGAPGTYYRVSVAYRINGGSNFSAFDDFSLGNIEAVPLPVTFMGVAAKRETAGVNVRWDVADERDLKEYQVERGTSTGNFIKVGSVASHGKGIYNFTDASAGSGTVYYRIRSIDLDGSGKYSSIVRIIGNNASSFSNVLKLYPIPAQNEVTVEHAQLGAKAKLVLSNADGKVIKVIYPGAGTSHTPVNLSTVSAGMYVIRLEDGNGKTQTIKFVKQ